VPICWLDIRATRAARLMELERIRNVKPATLCDSQGPPRGFRKIRLLWLMRSGPNQYHLSAGQPSWPLRK